jgi:hypothetical protein
MDRTTLLYAMSTLAQTCAALAAFVGAVGIYQLQTLTWRREALYQDIWRTQSSPTMTSQGTLSQARARADQEPTTAELLRLFDAMDVAIRRFLRVFRVFEGVTLLIVLLSLLSFAVIDRLVCSPLTRPGLMILSGAAVVATGCMLLSIGRGAPPSGTRAKEVRE